MNGCGIINTRHKIVNKYLIIVISIFQFQLLARADEEAYSMDELFLNANLIAHVKITSHTDQDFRVRVIDVLHHHRSGNSSRRLPKNN